MLKRDDIIERIAKKGYTKKDSAVIVDDFIEVVTEVLAEGESIQFHGFGTFEVKEVADRESVKVKTGERFLIPSHKAPRFIPGGFLKRAVKEGFVRG